MIDIEKIADAADMIVAGYAFTVEGNIVRVLNLEHPDSAAVIDSEDKIIETTMDDTELLVVEDIYSRNKCFLEGYSA